ncbi:hypothetical protein Mapa_002829 [Marchantia paleacea]|nr:hypothetical protein Mapa_002829 [Marchantia paleacea]
MSVKHPQQELPCPLQILCGLWACPSSGRRCPCTADHHESRTWRESSPGRRQRAGRRPVSHPPARTQ